MKSESDIRMKIIYPLWGTYVASESGSRKYSETVANIREISTDQKMKSGRASEENII